MIPLNRTVSKALLICLSALFISSCSTTSPKRVAEDYLSAMYNLDFQKAKTYSTEETIQLLDMMEGFSKMMPDSQKKEPVKFKILREKVEDDYATVYYRETGKDAEQRLPMVMLDGSWKVAMGKEVINTPMEDVTVPDEEDSITTPVDTAQ
jgi:hypothetical protein